MKKQRRRTQSAHKSTRCAYLKACYLADELRCFGFMTDCPLYLRSNDEPCHEARFHAAMNRLIDRTRAKHQRLEGTEDVGGEAVDNLGSD